MWDIFIEKDREGEREEEREKEREGEREEEREKVTKVLFTFDALFSGASERERERERKRGSSLTEEGSRSIFGAGVGEFSKFGGEGGYTVPCRVFVPTCSRYLHPLGSGELHPSLQIYDLIVICSSICYFSFT